MTQKLTPLTDSLPEFGLTAGEALLIKSIFQKYSALTKVMVFGSRATQTNKPTSDIDFVVWHTAEDSLELLGKLHADFEESILPYFVDIVDYNQISNRLLKEQIDMQGKEFSF